MARRPARKSAAKAGRASADRAVPPDASTREKIIAAFMALLAEKRFEEIGLVEIAEAAGVSLASSVSTNPGKTELIVIPRAPNSFL